MTSDLLAFWKKNKISFFVLLSFAVVYFILRLINIMSLPLFTDEAIYTRWSQIARFDAAWRFISLTDGKQPSFVWLDMIFMRFISDPLLAGRLVSVVSGFVSLLGLYLLTSELFNNKKIGLFASFLYLIFPFALVYDRMALYDSIVAASAIWALYLEILLVRKLRLDLAIILGMVIGFGVLTKTSAFFFIYLLPFSILLFNFKEKNIVEKIIKWIFLSSVSVVLAYAIYSILRLSPFYHIINDKNAIFVYTFREWLEHPTRFLIGNLRGQFDWLITYFTIPGIILVLMPFFSRKFIFEKLLMIIWFAAPFFALALFGRVLYPRFIFFMTMPLLVLAAYGLFDLCIRVRGYYLKGLVILVFVFLMLKSDYFIISNISYAPIPYADLEQYINGWPAGGGTKEIIAYLEKQAMNEKIYVASEGTFGSLPTYAVEIYLGDNKKVEKRGIYPIPPEIPIDLVDRAKKMPVYFIFNQTTMPPTSWPLELVAKYRKGVSDSYMSLYEVVPK